MRKTLFFCFLAVTFCSVGLTQQVKKYVANNAAIIKKVLLPNGWKLSPAGRSLPLGDLPMNIAVSQSKKYITVTNNGQGIQSLQLVDAKNEKVLDNITIPKSWYGLKFSADEKFVYASGGNDNWILKYIVRSNKLILTDSIKLGDPWPVKISPTGIELDDAAGLLYAVTKENNSLYVVDLSSKQILQQLELGKEAYTCILSKDKSELYISVWGGAKVDVYNTKNRSVEREISTGAHPNEMILSKDGKLLYVANADDNGVSIIDLNEKKVIETLNAALYPDAPRGSTPNGLALSENGNNLYVANADNNCLAVFDVSKPAHSRSLGFIPVGWYPTNVKVIDKKIFVTNGKGFSSFPNPNGPNPVARRSRVRYQKGNQPTAKVQYIGNLMKGTLSIIEEPDPKQLAVYSKTVYDNTPYRKEKELVTSGKKGNPIPMKVGDPSPIKYVFYIIKENRTYDQVLGDVQKGNGDKNLVLFGDSVTPNQHKIVNEFVLCDNFYVDGEVSSDGHIWSTAAYATDYIEKTWPSSYGDRGGFYDSEGNREIANPKKGFIWDFCSRGRVSFRDYGEFADDYNPKIPVLKDHICPYFTGWDLSVRDTTRFYQWARDFDSLVNANAVPTVNTLKFPNDHTAGLALGQPTPFAHVADNDLAVGMFVEHLSKSSVWGESVVFILEDDAQDGPDHVDAHRSTFYIAGGLVKRNYVDHTMYSTSSVLRTIELIAGLPPMSQYDAAATPLWKCFNNSSDITPFKALPARIDLNEKNQKTTASALLSNQFDFTKEDRVPDLLFSQIIWKAVKGENAVMPAPKRSAFIIETLTHVSRPK